MSLGTISYYLAKGIVKYNSQLKQQLKNEPELAKQIDELVEESKRVVEEVTETIFKNPLKIITGKYSKRTFDINNCGGEILNLNWNTTKIDKKGIEIVKKHLSRFEPYDWNIRMIERLEKIENSVIPITDFDKRFYTHEIREYERYKALGHEKTTSKDLQEEVFGELWSNTHTATLEDYKIYEKIEYQGKSVYSLYHPEVQF